MPPRVGLSFGSQTLQDTGLGLPDDPRIAYQPANAVSGLGELSGYAPPNAATATYGNQQTTAQTPGAFSLPEFDPRAFAGALRSARQQTTPQTPRVYFDADSGKMFTNGFEWDETNAAEGLRSIEHYNAAQADIPPPANGRWRPLSQSEYSNYVSEITNPTLGRLASEGFERGVRGMQHLGGSALRFVGAESAGSDVIADAERGFAANAPFQRTLDDIDGPRGFAEWAASSLGELGPSVLEAAGVTAAGAAIGGPAGAGAGLLTALERIGGQAAARTIARRYIAGEALSAAEMAVLRRTSGAAIAALSNSAAIGTSDIYGELRASGAGPEDLGARLLALVGSAPYAALDVAPEAYFLHGVLGGTVARGLRGRAANIAGRAGIGTAAEAIAEGGQEAITTGTAAAYSSGEWLTDENIDRMLNSAAVGGIGGTLFGGLSGATHRDAGGPATPDAAPAAPSPTTPAPTAPIDTDEVLSDIGLPTIANPAPTAPIDTDEVLSDIGLPTIANPAAAAAQPGEPYTPIVEVQPITDVVPGPIANPVAAAQQPVQLENYEREDLQWVATNPNFNDEQKTTASIYLRSNALQRQQLLAAVSDKPDLKYAIEQVRARANTTRPQPVRRASPSARAKIPPVQANPTLTPEQITEKLGDQPGTATRAGPVKKAEEPTAVPQPRKPNTENYLNRDILSLENARANTVRQIAALEKISKKDDPVLATLQDQLKAINVALDNRRRQIESGATPNPNPNARNTLKASEDKRKREEQALQRSEGVLPPKVVRGEKQGPERTADEIFRDARAEQNKLRQAQQETRQEAQPAAQSEDAHVNRLAQIILENMEKHNNKYSARQEASHLNKIVEGTKTRNPLLREDGKRYTKEQLREAANKAHDISTRRNIKDAIQKRSTEKVDAREQPATSEGVREGDTEPAATTGTSRKTKAAPAKGKTKARSRVAAKGFVEASRRFEEQRYATESAEIERLAGEAIKVKGGKPYNDLKAYLASHMNSAQQWISKHTTEDELYPTIKGAMVNNTARGRFSIKDDDNSKWRNSKNAQKMRMAGTKRKTDRDSSQVKTKIDELLKTMAINRRNPVEVAKADKELREFVAANRQATQRWIDSYDSVNYGNSYDALDTVENALKRDTGKFSVREDAAPVKKTNQFLMRATVNNINRKVKARPNVVVFKNTEEFSNNHALFNQASTAYNGLGAPGFDVFVGFEYKERVYLYQISDEDSVQAAVDATEEAFNLGVQEGKVKLDYYTIPTGSTIHTANNSRDVRGAERVVLPENMSALKDYELNAFGRIISEVGNRIEGYSFDDTIILFTDNIEAGQEARVYMHELAHFGLRAMFPEAMSAAQERDFGIDKMKEELAAMPASERRKLGLGEKPNGLNAMLEWVYANSDNVRIVTDRIMNERKIDLHKATEEAIVDRMSYREIEGGIARRIYRALAALYAWLVDNKVSLNKGDLYVEELIVRMHDFYKTGKVRAIINMNEVVTPTGAGLAREEMLIDYLKPSNSNVDGYETSPRTGMFSISKSIDDDDRDNLQRLANVTGATAGLEPLGAREIRERFVSMKDKVPAAISRVLEEVQTMNNLAYKSEGLRALHMMLREISYRRHTFSQIFGGLQKISRSGKASQKVLDRANELLVYSTLNRLPKASADVIKKAQSIVVRDANGIVSIDRTVAEKLREAAIVSPAEFNNGIEWMTAGGNAVGGTFKDETITADDMAYKIYLEQMKALFESHLIYLESILQENGVMLERDVNEMFARLETDKKNKITDARKAQPWLEKVMTKYLTIFYKESIDATERAANRKKAEEFLEQTLKALHNDAKINDWQTGNAKETAGFTTKEADIKEIVDDMPAMRKLGISVDQQIETLKLFQDEALRFARIEEAENDTKRSIMGGYVPVERRGKYEARLTAYDKKTDRPVKLGQEPKSALPYFILDDLGEIKNIAEQLNDTMDGKTFTLWDVDGNEVDVYFKAAYGETAERAALGDGVSFAAFMRMVDSLSINLTIEERERIIVGLTNIGDKVRARLERSGTPGWDKNTIHSINRSLMRTANAAAKNRYMPLMDAIWTNGDNWHGSADKLAALQHAFNVATTAADKRIAAEALDKYAYAYSHMRSPEVGSETFEYTNQKGKQKVKFKGRGERYKAKGQETVAFIRNMSDLDISTEDLLSKEGGGWIGLFTTLGQLGGSVASALVQFTSIPNAITLLSAYDHKSGRGGGFGDASAAAEVFRAFFQFMDPKWHNLEFINEVVDKKEWGKHNLTEDEAKTLQHLTAEGVLQAAYQTSLVGTAKDNITDAKLQRLIQWWMGLFGWGEMTMRSTTGIAAYRLYKQRALATGVNVIDLVDTNSTAHKNVVRSVTDIVFDSQGEYGMYNRPRLFRGNILSHIFKYKIFPVSIVQMIRFLPAGAKLKFLAILFLMAGLKGLPFADNIMDLLDGILQKLGIKQASVERALAELADDIIPGSSPILMRGVIDALMPGTFSTRASMGNLIPFTGAFRAGADQGRELANALGPVYTFTTGSLEWATLMADYALLQTPGFKDKTDTLADVFRASPISAVRALGDAYVYGADGSITDQRGRVISHDVSAGVVLSRAMGFYPSTATRYNDIIRLSRYHDDYIKAIRLRYVNAYARARNAGDRDRMRTIRESVDDWNRAAREANQDDFVIRNFVGGAMRASREADRDAVERYARTVARARRGSVEDLARAYGYDDDEEGD